MSSDKLTDQQVSEYFQECGAKCPFCGSYDHIDVEEAEYETDYAWRPNSCKSCGSTWTDQYRLTGILQKLSDKDGEDELEFANIELIKEIAKPATLNYYNIAWNILRPTACGLTADLRPNVIVANFEEGMTSPLWYHTTFLSVNEALDFLKEVYKEGINEKDVGSLWLDFQQLREVTK